jgi:hypothetical protein
MMTRALRLAGTVTVLGLLCGSAALMHAAALRGERRRRSELADPFAR